MRPRKVCATAACWVVQARRHRIRAGKGRLRSCRQACWQSWRLLRGAWLVLPAKKWQGHEVAGSIQNPNICKNPQSSHRGKKTHLLLSSRAVRQQRVSKKAAPGIFGRVRRVHGRRGCAVAQEGAGGQSGGVCCSLQAAGAAALQLCWRLRNQARSSPPLQIYLACLRLLQQNEAQLLQQCMLSSKVETHTCGACQGRRVDRKAVLPKRICKA